MSKTFHSLIESRVTTGQFDPHRAIDIDTIRELLRLATYAPSAFNLQNWRFIAVHSTEAKGRLCDLSYGQKQVRDAAVTFIVCGELDGYRSLRETLQPSVDSNLLPAAVQDRWSTMVTELHEGNPQLRRDEAFRSASLASMILMLAAQDRGLAAGAVGGFDAEGVMREFGLGSQTVPVLLVTVGYPSGTPRPRKVRKPVEAVMEVR